jgi:hypothetical protein
MTEEREKQITTEPLKGERVVGQALNASLKGFQWLLKPALF